MAQQDDDVAQGREFGFELNRFIKALLYAAALFVLAFFIFLVLAYMRISSSAFYTYNSYNDIPAHRVGLLLGTSSNVAPGQPNDFFTNRIMAAATLYHKGKIEYILVSGDNRHESYNEPRMMMNALLKAGVPLDHIVPDFAGFSTIDSVLRAHHVFLLNDMIIISQDFHNERAIFIARANGIKAIGFNASNPSSFVANFKVGVREFFARIKCVFDVYLLGSRPTYLGDPIAIGNVPLPKQATDKPKYPTSKPKEPGYSVRGLEELALLELRYSAKQPTDSALILNQQRKAVEAFQQTLLKEDEQSGNAPATHVPMSSPLDLPDEMTQSSFERQRHESARTTLSNLFGTDEEESAEEELPAASDDDVVSPDGAEVFDPDAELIEDPRMPALEIPTEVPSHLAAPQAATPAAAQTTPAQVTSPTASPLHPQSQTQPNTLSDQGVTPNRAQNAEPAASQAAPAPARRQTQPAPRRRAAEPRDNNEGRRLFGDPWE